MVNYSEAFKRPFQDIKKLLIGTVLYLIPIVNFLAFGYQLFCAKSAMKKDYKLPEWENWGDLFVKGLLSVIIGVIYFIPALIVLLFFAGTSFFAYLSLGMEIIPNLTADLGSGLVVFVILALLAAYVSPMAIMSFVETFNFKDAFKFSKVFRKSFTGKYFVTWLLMQLYSIITAAIFSFIPIVGGGLAGFVVGVTAFTAYAEAYTEAK